jgi:nucleoside-diphosphate-sugar epimerase
MEFLVAGHTGLVGSAVYEEICNSGHEVVGLNSKVVDLLDRKATFDL